MSLQHTSPSRPYYDKPEGYDSKRIELIKLMRCFSVTVRKCIDVGYTKSELDRSKLFEDEESYLNRLPLFNLKQCKDYVENRLHLYKERDINE